MTNHDVDIFNYNPEVFNYENVHELHHRGATLVVIKALPMFSPATVVRFPIKDGDEYLLNNKENYNLPDNDEENCTLIFPYGLPLDNGLLGFNKAGGIKSKVSEFSFAVKIPRGAPPKQVPIDDLLAIDQWMKLFYEDEFRRAIDNPVIKEGKVIPTYVLNTFNGKYIKF